MALDERVVAEPPYPNLTPSLAPRPTGRDGANEWLTLAACRGMDPSLFYSSDPQHVSRARTVCSMCVVRDACLQTALTADHPGLVGGFTERERARLAMMTQSAPLSIAAPATR